MNRPKILTTLGPKSLKPHIIKKLSDRNVDYFRINMSHTTIKQLEQHIQTIRRYSNTSLCIDSEGAQIRTGLSIKNITLYNRQKIKIIPSLKTKDENELGIWPISIFNQIKSGHVLTVDFDSVLLLICNAYETHADAVVLNGGVVGSNKAITIFPKIKLPALTKKDIQAVKLGLKYNVHNFALSFTNKASDVEQLRNLVGKDSTIISKIESIEGINNLDSILNLVDAILIDRGDLSREVPLENIPFLQKLIIKKGHSFNKEVYVATNLLESMLKNSKPTRAELNDVVNTLIDGANGLVLAAETAIGNNPIESVDILRSLITRYLKSLNGHRISDLLHNESILLPSLHGQSTNSLKHDEKKTTNFHNKLEIDEYNYLDCIQFSNNVYSPLEGFMDKQDLDSVLKNYKLKNGEIWPLPIILQTNKENWHNLKVGTNILLNFKKNTDYKIILKNIQLYKVDLNDISKKWFLTNDIKHPGVKRLFEKGSYLVSGAIQVTKVSDDSFSPYLLTPKQTRMIFNMKGWTKVVAFHTRNVPHRAHEYIMKKALEKSNADGLLIQPVIGPKKTGDFSTEMILSTYDILIKKYFPDALLCGFSTYSRYSGPREAVFTALCRKNFGCTHFIIGRDHTGVGDYYKSVSIKKLFDKLGDIGIKIIYFNKVGYDEKQKEIIEENIHNKNKDLKSISGSIIRNKLENNKTIPKGFIRSEIEQFLRKQVKNKKTLFIT